MLLGVNLVFLFLCNFATSAKKDLDVFQTRIKVTGGHGVDPSFPIGVEQVRDALMAAQEIEKKRYRDNQAIGKLVKLDPRTAGIFRYMQPTLPSELIEEHYSSKIISKALEILATTHCKQCDRQNLERFIKKILRAKFFVKGICEAFDKPDPQMVDRQRIRIYRTMDGSYNNLRHPIWGQENTVMPRLVNPDYCNLVDTPRCAKSGAMLPEPRLLSVVALYPSTKRDHRLNMFAAEFTQVISHDLSFQSNDNDLKTNIACCKADQSDVLPDNLLHESCAPMKVSKNDPFYKDFDIGCLHFVRSVAAPDPSCGLSVRQQISSVPGYFDLSLIYGGGDIAKSLRSLVNGKLREGRRGHMPAGCGKDLKNYCYESGDLRTNQQVHLASQQTIWFKNHNYICDQLRKLHPGWVDERVYQEARRINIAQYQHIVYHELLPLLIGAENVEDIFRTIDQSGYTHCYKESINGATYNDFSIAYRTLHSTLPSGIELCNEARKVISSHLYRTMLLNVTVMEATEDGLDNVVRGMMHSNMMKMDGHVTQEISTQMLPGVGHGYGTDLTAIDIQRGREHGTAGWNKYRKFCGLNEFKRFEDINCMEDGKPEMLSNLYEHVDDIDLIVGGLLEQPAPGSIFGPTITCIFKEQFERSLCGDRFFHTNIKQDYPITPRQQREIRKTLMSTLICQLSDNITRVTRSAFEAECLDNPLIPCSEVPYMSFAPWVTKRT